MNLNNNRTNKNQINNQKLETSPSEDRGQFISYNEHHKKRQFILAKRRNKAALNSIFYSFNL